jgi:hypothetical protein
VQSPLAHLVTAVACVAFAVIAPSAAYVAGIFITGNIGGPLNLILVPLLCGGLGLAVTALIYVPAAIVVELLVARFRFHRAWPAAVAIACAVLFGALIFAPALTGKDWTSADTAMAPLGACVLCFGFAIYWSALGFATALFQRRSWTTRDLLRLF